jgi:tetratricopeptide (TPR) repeat protein
MYLDPMPYLTPYTLHLIPYTLYLTPVSLMSSINKALEKAQRKRDFQQPEYVETLSGQRRSHLFSGKPLRLGGVLVIACLLAFVFYSWFDPIGNKTMDEKTIRHEIPVQSAVGKKDATPIVRKESAQEWKRKEHDALPVSDKSTISKIEDVEGIYDKARAFHKIGRFRDAKRLYQQVLNADPKSVDALNNIGVIYLHEKNYKAAETNFEQAIRLEPENVDPHYNLACVYSLKGDIERGISYLKKACSLNTDAKNWAGTDADLENLRGTPEFENIIKN